jgi:5-methylcytosine-specific restriction enzyme A
MIHKSDHHLTPRCRGGKDTIPICSDCHRAIHSLFSNKELERNYNSVEALMGDEKVQKMVAFLSKQDPNRRYKAVLSRDQRKRGRNA